MFAITLAVRGGFAAGRRFGICVIRVIRGPTPLRLCVSAAYGFGIRRVALIIALPLSA